MKYYLSLDNLVYKLIVRNEEDIELILPHGVPNDTQDNKTNNIFVSLNDIVVKLIIDTTKVVNVPKVEIKGKDEFTKIVTNGSFDLLPNSLMEVTFSTVDGGLHWLVNSCNANEVTAEEAEKIAKNAQEVAVDANQKSDTAVATSNVAKQTSETATANSLAAVNASSTAVSTAKEADGKSDTAVSTANDAKSIATSANSNADIALATANELDGRVDGIDTDIESINNNITTIDNTLSGHTTSIIDLDSKASAQVVTNEAVQQTLNNYETRIAALEAKINS